MKALTLTQPWATLVACGAKRIETRSWSTPFRGLLAIHAAKGLGPIGGKSGLKEQCQVPAFSSALGDVCGWLKFDLEKLPLGAIVATAKLVDVKRIDLPLRAEVLAQKVTPLEIEFGDYTSGRYAWYLESVNCLEYPIKCNGALSLWDVPPEVERQIKMQIAGITEADIAETRMPTLWPA